MYSAVLGFIALFVLCFLGVPLFIGLLVVGTLGFAWYRGLDAAFSVAGTQITDAVTSYGFSVIPLFVLMGAFIHRGGLADELFDAARAWLGHIRGGIAHATIGASGAFAAVCGSSIATAATMAKVSLPQMKRYQYEDGFACGAVAAGGTLGILIPPSVPLVIYGIITETDIAALFIAGLVPGIILAILYMLAAWFMVYLKPSRAKPAERITLAQRLLSTRKTALVGLLFIFVLGGMYFGLFTPTEAAGVGAFGAFLIMILRNGFQINVICDALIDTMITTASLLIVVGSSLVFNNFLTISGLTGELIGWIDTLAISPLGIIGIICVIYVLLGCVFDSLAAMILTVPIFTPLVVGLGYDPIWFGILVVMVVELGLITPPLGMNVFIVQNLASNVTIWQIFRGVLPFVGVNLIAIALVALIPAIALFLPSLM